MFDFKKIAKTEQDMTRERQAILDMLQSDGWKISFDMLISEMKEMMNASNIENEVDLKASQKATQILFIMLERIYEIQMDTGKLNQDLEENDLYKVISGKNSNPEDNY